jgi:hypothetical protein
MGRRFEHISYNTFKDEKKDTDGIQDRTDMHILVFYPYPFWNRELCVAVRLFLLFCLWSTNGNAVDFHEIGGFDHNIGNAVNHSCFN